MFAWLQFFLMMTLLLTGTTFILIAAIGLWRLPDVYCRAHGLGKALTLGLSCLLLALWIELGFDEAGVILPLAILFQFMTTPVASHLLARYARNRGISCWSVGRK